MAIMKRVWSTRGFDEFRQGSFGNGGQNLYVSKKGVLQRIYQYDLTGNGSFDLVFANCQNHHEAAPAFVYNDPLNNAEDCVSLPAQGAVSGAAADLTGSGFSDLIVCGRYDMAAPFASSDIYFGAPDGYSERRHIRIPTPWAESMTAGRFDGNALPTLAFSLGLYHNVRLFTPTELGPEWEHFTDIDIPTGQLAAGDLDGDGYDELIVRENDSTHTTIYWGGTDGISPERCTVMPELPEEDKIVRKPSTEKRSALETGMRQQERPQVVNVHGEKLLTVITQRRVLFYRFKAGRLPEVAFELKVPNAICVAVGDIFHDGTEALVVVAKQPVEGAKELQHSFVYRDCGGFYSEDARSTLDTYQASDAVIADFDGSGPSLAIGQSHSEYFYTRDILVFRGGADFGRNEPVRLHGEDTQRLLALPMENGRARLAAISHYARSAVGFDKSYVYVGDADGYRTDRRIDVPAWCAVDSLSCDVNDDGRPELIICNNSENSIHLDPGSFLHFFNEKGEFEPERSVTYPVHLGWGAIAADFDHSGYISLIFVAEHWTDLMLFPGTPDGPDPTHPVVISLEREDGSRIGSPRWIGAYDLNGNGYLDLVIPCISGERTLILWGGPEGYSMSRRQELAVWHGACCRAADLTGNGFPDLIIGTHTLTPVKGELPPHFPHHSYVHIYWNDGTGLRENNKTILRGDATDSIAVADFNNDGRLDIFAGSYHGGKDRDIPSFIYWNRPDGFHEHDCLFLNTHSASGCIAADFNDDGYIDLAIANHKVFGDHHGYSSVWWNGPEGFLPNKTTNLPTNGPHGMSAVEPGNVLTRGPEEYYTSAPFDAEEDVHPVSVNLAAEIPAKCWVSIRFRSSVNKEELFNSSWGEWHRLASGENAINPQENNRFWQYELALGAKLSLRSPRITEVTVEYE